MSYQARIKIAGNAHFPQRASTGYGLAALQCCLAVLVVVGLVAAPPVSGRMLLVPTRGESRDVLARLAIGAGARLVAPGPRAGSLVVTGKSFPLIAALMPGHALVLSASIGGCGERDVRP